MSRKSARRMHPVVILDEEPEEVDLTRGYDVDRLNSIRWGVGGYLERRTTQMYNSPLFADERTVHLGIDIWGPARTPVFAPGDGIIWGQNDNDNPRDYGPTVITEHGRGDAAFWVLLGHLSRDSLALHQPGDRVRAGEVIGYFGAESENGGWLPHLHLQVATSEPAEADMPGVVRPSDVSAARVLYPDPRSILGQVYRVDQLR